MKPRGIFKLPAAMLFCVSAWNLSANGFRLADQDAFATARGEAFVATADNPSAVYYNPAGITQLKSGNLRGGVYGIYLDPSYSPPGSAPNGGNSYHSSDHLAAVPQFFYTRTLNNPPLSLGLGVYAPYGGSVHWPDDTGFRTVATQGKLTYLTLNPVLAVKVLPSLSLGGGLMVNYADMNSEQGIRPVNLPSNINYFRFVGNGWSVGYNLGLRWQAIDQISIGATFRSAATVTLNGHTEFQQSGIPYTSLPARTDFAFPLTAVVGISCRPTSKWNLEFDADYTDWSSFGETTIQQLEPTPLGGPQNIPVTLDWQPSWMYEFGVTRYFDSGWHVSAGYVFNENSAPNTHYTPLVADLDRHFFSVGTGFNGKTFNFDVAYQFGYGPTHTVTGSAPPSAPSNYNNPTPNPADGRYRFSSSALIVSVGMHF